MGNLKVFLNTVNTQDIDKSEAEQVLAASMSAIEDSYRAYIKEIDDIIQKVLKGE